MSNYDHAGHIKLKDGREVHVEMDERGNVRANLIYDEAPPDVSSLAWSGMETRVMPRALWRLSAIADLKRRIRLYNDGDVSGSGRGNFSAGYRELVEIFGEPNANGDEHKVSTAWNVFFDGKAYHIYDYKETSLYSSDRPGVEEFRQLKVARWSVGGNSNADTFLAALHSAFSK